MEELPEPTSFKIRLAGGSGELEVARGYTSEQVRWLLSRAREEEREKAAGLCDRVAWSWDEQRPFAKVAQDCAAAIRAQS